MVEFYFKGNFFLPCCNHKLVRHANSNRKTSVHVADSVNISNDINSKFGSSGTLKATLKAKMVCARY
jgi:hypothetical protein